MRYNYYKWIIMILIIMFLLGCSETTTVPSTTEYPTSSEDVYTEDSNIDNTTVMEDLGYYEVLDRAIEYDIDTNIIRMYNNIEDEGILYVEIMSFLHVIDNTIISYKDLDEDVEHQITIEFDSLYIEEPYEVTIHSESNTISFSNFNYYFHMNRAVETNYQTWLTTVNYWYDEPNPEIIIDLNDYDMNITEENGLFYIPLYLANLFLTGGVINVYESDGDIFVVDDFHGNNELSFDESLMVENEYEEKIVEVTANYMTLFFDYFYGLKEYHGVESYHDVFDEIGLYDCQTLAELDLIIQSYIYSLNDLHTTVVDYGYNSEELDLSYPPADSKIMKYVEAYGTQQCLNLDYEFKLTRYEDFYVLTIVEFTLETKDYLTQLENINEDIPLIIDLSCNSGGMVIGVLELFTYVTDAPFNTYYSNPITDGNFSTLYRAFFTRAISNPLYVYTSNATFSAANLFVSMIKDYDQATIFGTSTSGGACIVNYTVLPNNLVMTYSSNFVFTDQYYNIIEAGVEPDIVIDEDMSLVDIFAQLDNYFLEDVDLNLVDNSIVTYIDLSMSLEDVPPLLDLVSFTVEIYDSSNDELIYSNDFAGSDFHLTWNLGSVVYDSVQIVVRCNYLKFGYAKEIEIYNVEYGSVLD